jgi:AcrR family transcriptional regulator
VNGSLPAAGDGGVVPLSRRHLRRTATVAEIKQAARQLVIDGGPGAISLRAISRALGMSPAALYRYFPSLEALVTDVRGDLYDEIRETVAAERDRYTDPREQLLAMARSFRTWSLAHPAEFALVFGNPIPGVQEEEECPTPDHPGAKFGAVFMGPFVQVWRDKGEPVPEGVLGQFVEIHGDLLPPGAAWDYLASWTRVYGLVAMEVFGHMRWALPDMEMLFESELRRGMRDLS